MNNRKREIATDNRLDELSRINDCLDRFAQDARVPDTARRTLALIIDELFSNTIQYGYAAGQADTILVTFELEDGDVKMTIRDHAEPFDVAETPKRHLEEIEMAEMEVGGLGLFLVHQFARLVNSRYDKGTNITEIWVPLDASDT